MLLCCSLLRAVCRLPFDVSGCRLLLTPPSNLQRGWPGGTGSPVRTGNAARAPSKPRSAAAYQIRRSPPILMNVCQHFTQYFLQFFPKLNYIFENPQCLTDRNSGVAIESSGFRSLGVPGSKHFTQLCHGAGEAEVPGGRGPQPADRALRRLLESVRHDPAGFFTPAFFEPARSGHPDWEVVLLSRFLFWLRSSYTFFVAVFSISSFILHKSSFVIPFLPFWLEHSVS